MIIRYLLTLFIILSGLSMSGQENTAILCGDGIDNDGDGLIDCEDSECMALPNEGCVTCNDSGLSFGDVILSMDIICTPENIMSDPQEALGIANYNGEPSDGRFLSLGRQGSVCIGFTDNILVNSGDNAEDLWVFEIGPAVESTSVSLRPFDQATIDRLESNGLTDDNGDGYYFIANIQGATRGLDIDEVSPGFFFADLRFDAVMLIDLDGNCGGTTPGADIDAICALSAVEVDCAGELFGTAILDECGECLQPNDPTFNTTCLDCNDVINGVAVIDSCGLCLDPADPSFNASCTDCSGIVNGTFLVDECGLCLDSLDMNFNQSCLDCAGTPNGSAILDLCGDCHEPNDPAFNQACAKDKRIYIPNVITINSSLDGSFILQAEEGAVKGLTKYMIYDRWGNLMTSDDEFFISFEEMSWWDGKDHEQGVYTFYIEVEYWDGERSPSVGNFTLIKQ